MIQEIIGHVVLHRRSSVLWWRFCVTREPPIYHLYIHILGDQPKDRGLRVGDQIGPCRPWIRFDVTLGPHSAPNKDAFFTPCTAPNQKHLFCRSLRTPRRTHTMDVTAPKLGRSAGTRARVHRANAARCERISFAAAAVHSDERLSSTSTCETSRKRLDAAHSRKFTKGNYLDPASGQEPNHRDLVLRRGACVSTACRHRGLCASTSCAASPLLPLPPVDLRELDGRLLSAKYRDGHDFREVYGWRYSKM